MIRYWGADRSFCGKTHQRVSHVLTSFTVTPKCAPSGNTGNNRLSDYAGNIGNNRLSDYAGNTGNDLLSENAGSTGWRRLPFRVSEFSIY